MGKRGVGLLYGATVQSEMAYGSVPWIEWYEALTKEQMARLSANGCRCTRPLRFAHIWEANPPLVGFWIEEDLDGCCDRVAGLLGSDEAIRAEVAWRRLVSLALEMDVILPVGPTSWIVPNEVA